jgi:predicted GTPase
MSKSNKVNKVVLPNKVIVELAYEGGSEKEYESDSEEEYEIHPELPIVPVDNINICFVGGVSTGKSTILNAIFCEELTQCKIKRTTMVPTIYVENENETNNLTSPDLIFKTISSINSKIIKKTETGQLLKKDDYNELVFNVGKLDINILEDSYVNVYDIPGLNDVRTKNTYYSYLDDNFTKFNLVILIVDIHSGLNTSDEIEIVNYITNHTKKEYNQNNKKIYTLVVVNKADYMQLEDENGDKLILTGELNEMFEQVQNTITSEFSRSDILEHLIGIIPLCALDSYLYRMVNKHGKKFKLSQEQILKIGINEEGKKFSKLKPITQENKVYKVLEDKNFINDMIKLSGFSHLESILHSFLNKNNTGKEIRINNLLCEMNKLPKIYDVIVKNSPTIVNSNINELIHKYNEILNSIKKIDNEKFTIEMNLIVAAYIEGITYCIKSLNNFEYIISQFILVNDEILQPYFNGFLERYFENSNDFYPLFIKSRIFDIITKDITDKIITIGQIIKVFNDLKYIGSFTKPIISKLIEIILSNKNQQHTFANSKQDKHTINKFVELLNECEKIDVNISKFIRFVLICLFKTYERKDLVKVFMVLSRYGEIPLNTYLGKVILNDNHINNIPYIDGLEESDLSSMQLEMYYLSYEKIHNPFNFKL